MGVFKDRCEPEKCRRDVQKQGRGVTTGQNRNCMLPSLWPRGIRYLCMLYVPLAGRQLGLVGSSVVPEGGVRVQVGGQEVSMMAHGYKQRSTGKVSSITPPGSSTSGGRRFGRTIAQIILVPCKSAYYYSDKKGGRVVRFTVCE